MRSIDAVIVGSYGTDWVVFDPALQRVGDERVRLYSIVSHDWVLLPRGQNATSIGRLDRARSQIVRETYESEREKVLQRHAAEEAERERRHNAKLQRHRGFIEALGTPYPGIRPRRASRRRITHCYACRRMLDNQADEECSGCGWIVCECGACGCGYLEQAGHAPES